MGSDFIYSCGAFKVLFVVGYGKEAIMKMDLSIS